MYAPLPLPFYTANTSNRLLFRVFSSLSHGPSAIRTSTLTGVTHSRTSSARSPPRENRRLPLPQGISAARAQARAPGTPDTMSRAEDTTEGVMAMGEGLIVLGAWRVTSYRWVMVRLWSILGLCGWRFGRLGEIGMHFGSFVLGEGGTK